MHRFLYVHLHSSPSLPPSGSFPIRLNFRAQFRFILEYVLSILASFSSLPLHRRLSDYKCSRSRPSFRPSRPRTKGMSGWCIGSTDLKDEILRVH
ncbi:hypothetical protein EUGRSUZ_G00726 [Eucalyptus grandis]|uniref:Uncharacterized protein n=2 Tax=Eucalyptus grandis TaxID=71139 RepID=A0ACC3K0F4_EUCGR|nr:hypothetical protein EUGRSUZ_G00726 [Eucalyptus grandis]